jgi:DNA-binding PadR family transcriptional regulator
MAKKTIKAMPKCATETKQGAKIAKEEVTLTIKGTKKTVKVYAITVAGKELYAMRRPLAPVDNAKYLPLEKLAAAKNTRKPRKAVKAAKAQLFLSDAAMAMVPVLAKLGKGEIKLLAIEALKYKRANAKLVKAQIKADKLKAKRDALQAQIEALETAGK